MMLPIINGVLLPLTIANMHLVEIGQKPIYIINDQFLNSFVFFGGAGATLCLIIAIFIVNRNRRKKSEVQLAISKIAGVPGIFNINEPLIFGLPICLDTVYLIPFVLVPLVNVVVAYFSMASHLVPLVQLEVTWTLPPIISGALATNSWQGAILSLILMIVDILIYIPFVIVAADRDYNVQHSAQTVSE
jgi:PTS system cellobiose-specific IIC component